MNKDRVTEQHPLRVALDRAAGVTPYFQVVWPDEAHNARGPWAPDVDSAAALTRAVDHARNRLCTSETRVAWSSVQFDISARIASVLLGAWWFAPTDQAESVVALSFVLDEHGKGLVCGSLAVAGASATPRGAGEDSACQAVPWMEAVHAAWPGQRVSDQLLWGNLAAAFTGAARALASREQDARSGEVEQWDTAGREGALSQRLRDWLAGVHSHPTFAGHHRVTGTGWVRRSCCLYYRSGAGGASTCADCPVAPDSARAARQRLVSREQARRDEATC